MSREIPKPGEFYRHFKNKMYQIVTVCEHSETREKLVVYQALYGTFATYARPLDMFMSEVDHKKYPDVKQKYRFEQMVPGEEEETAGGKASKLEETERLVKLKLDRILQRDGKYPEKAPDGRPFRMIETSRGKSEARVQKKRELHLPIIRREHITIDETPDNEIELQNDYLEAQRLMEQDNMVLPRSERQEEKEAALWESLTKEATEAAGMQEYESDEDLVSPRFIDYLEARTYESKAVILETMKDELDDEMIDGLALAIDVEIPPGTIKERFRSLKKTLETMAKFEDVRLR